MKSLSLSQPHLIALVGIPGSGKTFFAEKFAETFHAPYVSHEKIAVFAKDAAKPITFIQLEELLKTNQSVVVDGLTDTRTERADLAKIARANGYETLFVWVQTDPQTAKIRTMKARTLGPEEYNKAVRRFTAPNEAEKPVVVSGKHTYATQAKVVLKKLSAPRAEISVHIKPIARAEQPGRRNITVR